MGAVLFKAKAAKVPQFDPLAKAWVKAAKTAFTAAAIVCGECWG